MKSITEFIKSQDVVFEQTLDIDKIMKNVNVNEYDYITKEIQKCIHNSLITIDFITIEYLNEIKHKLKQYRLVDDIYLLHKGKYARWINKNQNNGERSLLHNGGVVVDIKFVDNGTNFVIFNKYNKRYTQIQFDNVLLFQKLSLEEEMILHLKSTI